METITGIIEKLKNYIEITTNHFKKLFEENNLDKIKKFVPAYVYFMKNYYMLLSQYEIANEKKKNDGTPNLDKIKSLINDINKTLGVINLSNKEIGFTEIKIGAKDKNKTTSLEKMSHWTEDTPKDKMLSHLELWTGEKGEKAVLKTLVNLKSNTNLLFDKIMHLHGVNDYSNKIISIFVVQIEKLFKYYLNHRNKYLPESIINEKRRLFFGDKVLINFSDEFMTLDIKFGICDFDSFTKTIISIINGIDALDVEILTRNHDIKAKKEKTDEKNVILRQSLKKRIKELAELVGGELHCNILKKNVNFDASEIIHMVQALNEAEKIILKEMNTIRENLKIQTSNANMLEKAVEDLIGPDTAPCILHFIKYVRGMSLEEAKKLLIT